MNAPTMPLPFADDRQRQEALLAHLVGAGYVRAEPPLLQPASAFFESGEDMRGRLFLTSDINGAELCLRPEYTIPVCRQYIASADFGHPAAYSYCGPVFRLRRDGPGEFVQAGIENFGHADREAADAEILALVLEMRHRAPCQIDHAAMRLDQDWRNAEPLSLGAGLSAWSVSRLEFALRAAP